MKMPAMNTYAIILLAVGALLLSGSAVFAQDDDLDAAGAEPAATAADFGFHDIHFLGAEGDLKRGIRCGTPQPTAAERAQVGAAIDDLHAAYGPAERRADIEIPVAFHVVYRSTANGEVGNVPDEQIEAQIAVLNRAYRRSGFSFYLASVDRRRQNNWFRNCASPNKERKMKRRMNVDPATTLNVYTCEPLGGDLLGFATFPWFYDEDDNRHGVVLLHSSLPDGAAAPYNEGDTLVHEVGHYLGLYHTFAGGCAEPGDLVADTAPEASPAYGCPRGRNTCPGGGRDPIRNYMDYVDDFCMTRFSNGQRTRMQDAVFLFKPSLGNI